MDSMNSVFTSHATDSRCGRVIVDMKLFVYQLAEQKEAGYPRRKTA
jgi:hypothetical protein